MKIALTFLISSILVTGLFLIGLGCDDKSSAPPPKPKPTPPKPEVTPRRTEPPADPYKGFLTPEESQRWLNNNHFQVQRKPEGDGYIITCKYYDPGPPSISYDTRTTISGRSTASISGPASALVTIDINGKLRVMPSP